MQLDCHPIPIDLMHNQVKQKVKLQNKIKGYWLNVLGLALLRLRLRVSFFGWTDLSFHFQLLVRGV
jgi:hypothetical protein